jgi:serine/threonine-protein kinase
LHLYDRKGVGEMLQLPVATYAFPRVSPDGTRLAVEVKDGRQAYVAIYDLSGATAIRRLTFGGNNRNPVWSADGARVAFASDRDGDIAVFWQPANGGTAERLTKPEAGAFHVPEAWSPSGDTLLFNESRGTQTSLWAVNVGRRTATRVPDTTSVGLPTDAAFSPDGHWIAYQIGDAGVGEATTFVQPYPPTGEKYQIARGGRPAWSRDGKELFVVPAPGRLLLFTVHTRPSFSFSNPVDIPRGFGVAEPGSQRTYDPMPDGRLVGINYRSGAPGGASLTPEIRIVLNWFEDLKARMQPSKP